jgi:hypothetical protein
MPQPSRFFAIALVVALAGCSSAAGVQPATTQFSARPGTAAGIRATSVPAADAPATPAETAAPTGTAPTATRPSPTAAPLATAGPMVAPASPAQAVAAEPAPEPDAATLPVYSMDLYRRGDFVRQYTNEWCVGASIQMTLNMLRARNDRLRALQRELWELARDHSDSPYGGANPRGWVAALNEVGVGPYTLVSIPTYDEALRVAARALRATRRPVGLVMWRGRHAWVMSGFSSRGDPARHRSFRVTGVDVVDPLYPNGSRAWGPSPRPGARISPATLAKQFVRRDRGRMNLGVPPGYLLVLPRS